MAKQSGIHQLRGKFGGNVYYSQKGVDGGLVRKINEGMSSRVKNDAAFANTRRNANEFGFAGGLSGAAVRSISKRWRTILDPFAVGKFASSLIQIIRTSNNGDWGGRVVGMSVNANLIKTGINVHAKNQYSENFAMGITYEIPETGGVNITGSTTAETSQGLKDRGAEGVLYEFYAYDLFEGQFVESAGRYTPSSSAITLLGSVDAEIGQVTSLNIQSPTAVLPTSSEHLFAVLVVALPYKVVHNEKYTLQELCSFELI